MFSTIVAHMLKSGKTVYAVKDNGYVLALRPLEQMSYSSAAKFMTSLFLEGEQKFLALKVLSVAEESNT